MTSEEQSTFFPKITNSVGGIIKLYREYMKTCDAATTRQFQNRKTVTLTGTVKLHGTHIDLVFYVDNTWRIQSRNQKELTIENDNMQAVKTLLPLYKHAIELRNKFIDRHEELNGKKTLRTDLPIIIAGEWVGPGVQKNAVLNKLYKKAFVIIGANMNGSWVDDEKFRDINHEQYGFFNVGRGGYCKAELNLRDYTKSKEQMRQVTMEIGKQCRFAATLGIVGPGEGIVWKLEHPLGANPRFWVKTLNPQYAKSTTEALLQNPSLVNDGVKPKAVAIVEACVGEMRMQQAWDYLIEMGRQMNIGNELEFISWLFDDVVEEEKVAIEEFKIGRKALRKAIEGVAKPWFAEKLVFER